MTAAEMNNRLAEITASQVDRVSSLIRDGYGATGIRFETGLSVRLINAVFRKVQG